MDTHIKPTATLIDGTVVHRAYQDEFLEEQRIKALNYLGTRWPYHPANSPKKGDYSDAEPVVIKKTRNFILQDYLYSRHKEQAQHV